MFAKSLFFALLICLLPFVSAAQQLPGGITQSDFRNNQQQKSHNYYAFVGFKAPHMINKWGVELGMRTGAFVNDNFAVGFAYNFLFSKNIEIPDLQLSGDPFHLRLAYGGLDLDYSLHISSFLRLAWSALFAYGHANYSIYSDVDVLSDQRGDWLFIVEPAQHILVDLYDGYFINFSIAYRSALDFDYIGLSNKDLTGAVFTFTFGSYF